METLFWIYIVAVAAFVAAAGFTDFQMQRIPNYLTVPAAVFGLAINVFFPQAANIGGWSASLLGFALGFGLLLVPFLLKGGGTGDVKLLAGLGACLGPKWLFIAFVMSLFVALALVWIMWMAGFSRKRSASVGELENGRSKGRSMAPKQGKRKRRGVPFAIPIAVGTWCVLCVLVARYYRPQLFEPTLENPPIQRAVN